MDYTRLVSSAAVMRSLFDSKNDIQDVISEFIKAYINLSNIKAFSTIDCKVGLNKDFGFDLPEAVINTCIRTKLVKSEELVKNKGSYVVTENFSATNRISEGYESTRTRYSSLIWNLSKFCLKHEPSDTDINEVRHNFENYLLRKPQNGRFDSKIAEYILENESSIEFKELITLIEEGLIIYTGVKYTPDLSSLGSWKNNLTIYLDSHHLYNAAGFNGELFKQLFDDFFSLIQVINGSKKGGKIQLRYFIETSNDIDAFFYAAENILSKKARLDPSKKAMVTILNDVSTRSEVALKKARFLSFLDKKGITKESKSDYYNDVEYNIESAEVTDHLSQKYPHEDADYSENDISKILKIFTKINVVRKGENNTGFDGIKAIFLTDNKFYQKLSFDEKIFSGNGDIPFVTNIEYITQKFWFKLNRGFGGNVTNPSTFDSFIKARLVLSAQINKDVSKVFKDIIQKRETSEIDDQTLVYLHDELNRYELSPESVTLDSFYVTEDKLENFAETVIKEKALLKQDAEEGRKARIELRRHRWLEKVRPIRRKTRVTYTSSLILLLLTIPLILIAPIPFVITPQDSMFAVYLAVISLASIGTGVWKINSIKAFLRPKIIRNYRNKIRLLTTTRNQ